VRAIRNSLLRAAYRVGYRVLRVWWAVRRPKKDGVKCVIARGGEILMVRHTYGPTGRWELPGGGVKRREPPLHAAQRETREEVGIDTNDWRPLGDLYWRIDRKRDRLWCFKTEYDGQPIVRDEAEIAEARWFDRAELPAEAARYVPLILALG
jgi:8-oxo-dGTP pyrophosphatase MutT (NUDIX family)